MIYLRLPNGKEFTPVMQFDKSIAFRIDYPDGCIGWEKEPMKEKNFNVKIIDYDHAHRNDEIKSFLTKEQAISFIEEWNEEHCPWEMPEGWVCYAEPINFTYD